MNRKELREDGYANRSRAVEGVYVVTRELLNLQHGYEENLYRLVQDEGARSKAVAEGRSQFVTVISELFVGLAEGIELMNATIDDFDMVARKAEEVQP